MRKVEVTLPSRPTAGPASRLLATLAALAIGGALVAGCAGSTSTQAPVTTGSGPATQTSVATAAPTTAGQLTATPAPSIGGAIVFQPATFSCADSTTPLTITWTLGPSVTGDQPILYEWDGSLGQGGQEPTPVSDAGFVHEQDGTWQQTENTTGSELCASVGLSAGDHTWQVVQGNSDGTAGATLAQGSFTATP